MSSCSEDMESNAPADQLVLRFSFSPNGHWASYFEEGEVSYEGGDTYRFEAKVQGQPLILTFLSRAATAEYLELALNRHTVQMLRKNDNFTLNSLEGGGYSAFMRYLLILRDARVFA